MGDPTVSRIRITTMVAAWLTFAITKAAADGVVVDRALIDASFLAIKAQPGVPI